MRITHALGALALPLALAACAETAEPVSRDALPFAPSYLGIETGLLDHDQKVIACALSKVAGAAYVKTSTGFGAGRPCTPRSLRSNGVSWRSRMVSLSQSFQTSLTLMMLPDVSPLCQSSCRDRDQ